MMGALIKRSALLSDIHGNSPALKAVIDDVRRSKCTRVFVLGDTISGIDPHGCVELLQAWGHTAAVEMACIKGNAELYLMTPDLNDLWERGEPWNADIIRLIQWIEAHLSAADLDWIRHLPEFILLNGACLVHDSPMDRLTPESWHRADIESKYQEWFYHSPGVSEDMAPADWQKLLAFMQERRITQVFCGHTHKPFLRELDGRLIVNTGSVGAPCDGDPRAAWVLLEENPGEKPVIQIRRVDYDIPQMLQLIDATPDYPDFSFPGFREAYKKYFSTGIHWSAHLPS